MQEESKQVLITSVQLMLLGMSIMFFLYVMNIRGEYGAERNSEMYSRDKLAEYLEFNKYELDEVLTGADVIQTIREYYNNNVAVSVRTSASATSTVYAIRPREYINNREKVKLEYLQGLFSITTKYKAYIYRGSKDISTVSLTEVQSIKDGDVTGILFVRR